MVFGSTDRSVSIMSYVEVDFLEVARLSKRGHVEGAQREDQFRTPFTAQLEARYIVRASLELYI